VEIAGPETKIDSFVELLRPYGIRELVRTGRIAMLRGMKEHTRQITRRV
jgi:acetolactate synthase-1/3 small subunit